MRSTDRARRFPASLLAVGLSLLGIDTRASDTAHWREQGHAALVKARGASPVEGRARNVVLMIGDGMGVSTVTAARIFAGQQRGEPGEEGWLAFETLPHVALAKTYNTNQQVPDSAGTMTAMVTGVKTRAGAISVGPEVPRGDVAAALRGELATLFEQAEDRGMRTGIVTTTTVTHATPAPLYAHSPERGWEDDSRLSDEARAAGFPDLARQLIAFEHGDGVDVVLGGGRGHFQPADADPPGYRQDGRDLVREWSEGDSRRRSVFDRTALAALPEDTEQVLGLFAPSHMAFEADRERHAPGEPSLAEMTDAALDVLERGPEGYVLMVEGGRIDHGHHLANAYRALTDTVAFDEAVARVLARTDSEDTLVVVTADHSHVLTLAGYGTRGNPILGKVVPNDPRGDPRSEPARDDLGLPYTVLGYQNGPGYTGATNVSPEGAKFLSRERPTEVQGIAHGRPDLSDVDTQSPNYLQETTVPMRFETHAGEDVAIYASGPAAQLFRGVQEQSYVYYVIVEALGWERKPGFLERLFGGD